MFTKIIIVIAGGAAVIFWLLSTKPERSWWTEDVLSRCTYYSSCKTTLCEEVVIRNRRMGWLGIEGYVSNVFGQFPSYIDCALARAKQVEAFQEKSKGSKVTVKRAHALSTHLDEGSVSVIVDGGSNTLTTHTFFCGYQTLEPDGKDRSGLGP